jgi:hypothetical protein
MSEWLRLAGGKFWVKSFNGFSTLIKSIKHSLIIKIVTWTNEKSRDESIKSK